MVGVTGGSIVRIGIGIGIGRYGRHDGGVGG